jgi:xylulokinase
VRGVIFGLTLEHDRKHIVRAILEGSAFAARHLMEVLENIGVSVDRVYMVGGGAQGQLWARIRSNVMGKPVVMPNVSEATGLGCALLTYIALGVFDSFEKAVAVCVDLNETITPDPSSRIEYERRYHLYMRLRKRLEESFAELADL